ncbi:MAG: PadR family transcriptional regulator [Saprospiraceae bacterium]|nr:PadR family transcriptional regulator [Saprospiraceae bacterium]
MKNKRIGEFEEVVLLLVGILGQEAYALKIAEEYRKQTGKTASIGAVHSALVRMSKKGFLRSAMGAPTDRRGGRRKRIYEVTALGHRTLSHTRDLRMSLWRQYPGFAIKFS